MELSSGSSSASSEISVNSNTSASINANRVSGFKRRKITLVTEAPKPSFTVKQDDCKEYLAMVLIVAVLTYFVYFY